MLEVLIPDENKVVGAYSTPNPTHKHKKWELTLFEEGTALNIINGVSYTTGKGDMFLLGPPHLHAIEILNGKHLHKDIYFDESVIERLLDTCLKEIKDEVLTGKTLITLHLDIHDLSSVQNNISKLENLCIIKTFNQNSVDIKIVKEISQSVLHYIFGIYATTLYIKQTKYPEWFYAFLNNLNKVEVFTQNVNSIVAQTHYSHTQFSKLFKKFCGLPLVEYLKNLRLAYACELLNNTEYSTIFICENCGYDSYSYFERSFKEKFGCTPIQYRRKNQNNKVPQIGRAHV